MSALGIAVVAAPFGYAAASMVFGFGRALARRYRRRNEAAS